jgi:protein-S-isoprenylcysteine O-methyltransferase Ste14
MDPDTIFRIAMILLFVAFQFPRTHFRIKARKTRTDDGDVDSSFSESKWRLILMGLSGLGTNLVALLWVINPEWLTWSNLNMPLWLRWVGVAVGVLTVLMSFFVHRTLGRNFTPTLETPEENQLVTDGVYALIRHPMYTTFFMLFLSSFLITTNWLIALFGTIYWFLILNRVKTEEAMMLDTFGDQYQEYMHQSGRFIPSLFSSF